MMIELFSKDPGYQIHRDDMVITPLHISDEISSLSAIMLNDDYYNFMMNGRSITYSGKYLFEKIEFYFAYFCASVFAGGLLATVLCGIFVKRFLLDI